MSIHTVNKDGVAVEVPSDVRAEGPAAVQAFCDEQGSPKGTVRNLVEERDGIGQLLRLEVRGNDGRLYNVSGNILHLGDETINQWVQENVPMPLAGTKPSVDKKPKPVTEGGNE